MPVHKTDDLDHKAESESTAVGALQTASNEALRLALRRATRRATATQQCRSSETPEASTRIARAARKAALDAMRRMAVDHEESLDDRKHLLDATAPEVGYPQPASRPLSPSPEPEKDVEWESAWTEEGHHRSRFNDGDEHLEVVVECAEPQPAHPDEVISVDESSSDTDRVGSPRNPQRRQRRKNIKVKRTFSTAERATALRIHRIHLLSMLASALYFDQLADAALIQGRALSLVPLDIAERFDFVQKRPQKDRGMAFIDALTCFVLWFASNYRMSPIPCDLLPIECTWPGVAYTANAL
ncbi:hypothetical protein F1559_003155 [Cyanidiococcus yangmingshanensis]|uniref:Uncharacterized protein n=1 Tax=Cyanidiococcus yangmingshanensis TaxID=2690220 RepID=A0A7J7IKF1_9RHOD|nr:hypothetical protein F1559_003155 [Cyanidiococcus yangmingshanensis]